MDGWSHHLELSFENSGQGKYQVQRGRTYSHAINVFISSTKFQKWCLLSCTCYNVCIEGFVKIGAHRLVK